MDKSVIIVISISITALILLAGHHYIFSIYELTYNHPPLKLFADGQSTLTIEAIPVNSLGMKAPLRDANTTFEIVEGSELVEVILNDFKSGVIQIKAKNNPGKVIIKGSSAFSMLPSSFEITIEPNYANLFQ